MTLFRFLFKEPVLDSGIYNKDFSLSTNFERSSLIRLETATTPSALDMLYKLREFSSGLLVPQEE
jgi:hypothetical protein